MVFHMAPYSPPAAAILAGVELIVLPAAAYRVRSFCPEWNQAPQPAPSPWIVAVAAFLAGRAWQELTPIAFGEPPRLDWWIPVAAAAALAAGFYVLVLGWSRRAAWRDAHRFALACGAILAVMTAGYRGQWTAIDLLARGIFTAGALALLFVLARKLGNRPKAA